MSQYQTAGVNARLRLFALLETQGVLASEADGLVAAVEAGAQSEVVELDGVAPASRGPLFAGGWDESVTAVSEALVGIADWNWSRRGGRLAGSAQLAVHLTDVRQRERVGLVRLEGFVRESVLPRTYPLTTARRRVLEALCEADGLCTARMLNTDGDVVVCTCDAGHYAPDDKPVLRRRRAGRLAQGGCVYGTTWARPAFRTRPSERPQLF
ncbi:hypothetical protein [Streptomyces sp. NPDC001741]|uniref:hypothetical protein n=1 Tax=Streptomyces sp. NPDC001741 TaxID=3364605 RepID=UPI0036C69CD7